MLLVWVKGVLFMNVMISVNDSFVMPTTVMLKSLCMHNPVNPKIYVLYTGLSKESKETLRVNVGDQCELIYVDCTPWLHYLSDFQLSMEYLSFETYYRLLIREVIPSDVDRILWLDGDMIINGNLEDFYNTDFEGNGICVCEIRGKSPVDAMTREKLGLDKDEKVFNAGVILYNMQYFEDHPDYFDQVKRIAIEYQGRLEHNDQDVLHLLYRNQIKWADEEIYNKYALKVYTASEEKRVKATAKIIHFCGSMKPWKNNYRNRLASLFWEYCNQTTFSTQYENWKKANFKYRLLPYGLMRCLRRKLRGWG